MPLVHSSLVKAEKITVLIKIILHPGNDLFFVLLAAVLVIGALYQI